nr:phage terminase large subunit [Pseudonocardia oroxyli]
MRVRPGCDLVIDHPGVGAASALAEVAVSSFKRMEVTEPAVAKTLNEDGVGVAEIESNNGGRGWARNVERELKALGSVRCVVKSVPQTQNKEACILASSARVTRHVFMPQGWKHKYPEFYRQVKGYQKKGKSKHDDGPDVRAAIYERVANPKKSGVRVRTA